MTPEDRGGVAGGEDMGAGEPLLVAADDPADGFLDNIRRLGIHMDAVRVRGPERGRKKRLQDPGLKVGWEMKQSSKVCFLSLQLKASSLAKNFK